MYDSLVLRRSASSRIVLFLELIGRMSNTSKTRWPASKALRVFSTTTLESKPSYADKICCCNDFVESSEVEVDREGEMDLATFCLIDRIDSVIIVMRFSQQQALIPLQMKHQSSRNNRDQQLKAANSKIQETN
ncbi:hypothetical protein PV328_011163 [Microctonus aethiopoides]|uniref:Uncharacterized protein n=1 Tax=Microctonus aethiopoides TaxID=144406 RepID=A0AA39C3X2_9HYME|nr:hypothetical protein PV328_011163 [Microctonus aethiopoides]